MNTELLPAGILPNELINGRYEYTSKELDLMLRIYGEVRRRPVGNIYQMQIKELAELMGETGRNYEYLREAIRQLIRKPMEFWNPEEKKLTIAPPIGGAQFDRKTGKIDIYIMPQLAKWIRETRTTYTEFDLSAIMRIKGRYSKRIYLMCRQFLATGYVFKKPDELRGELKVDGYADLQDLKKRIIYPAIAEINEHTELTVQFSVLKHAKKVDVLQFTVALKEAAQDIYLDTKQIEYMIKEGLAPWQAQNVALTLTVTDIAKALYDYKLVRDRIRARAPYLVRIFENRGVVMNQKIPNQLKIA